MKKGELNALGWAVLIFVAISFFGTGWIGSQNYFNKNHPCPEANCMPVDCTRECETFSTLNDDIQAFLNKSIEKCPTVNCPSLTCPDCNCNCKSTADKSIHFKTPTLQCENYNPNYPEVRVRGSDQITYRWYNCATEEWKEGDVDEDGWLQI